MTSPDTYGWDTVFAMRLAVFNAAVGTQTGQPISFAYASHDDGHQDSQLDWRFGRWQVSAAFGQQLTAECDLAEGRLAFRNLAPADLSGARCIVTVTKVLEAPVTSPGADWSIVQVKSRAGGDNILATDAFKRWFATGAGGQAISDIFAGIRINTKATDDDDWVRPRAGRVAGAGMPDGDTSIGFLARTASDSIVGMPVTLSPYCIPTPPPPVDKTDAVFLISAERTLAIFLRPALCKVFGTDANPDVASSQFPIADGSRITNNAPLSFPVTCEGGKVYTAKIATHDLTVSLEADTLCFTISKMSFDIDVGQLNLVTVNMRLNEYLIPTLVSAPADPGRLVFMLVPKSEPNVVIEQTDSLSLSVAQDVVAIVGVIASALINKFMPGGLGARFGFSPLVSKFIAATVAEISALIGQAVARIPDFISDAEMEDLAKLPAFADLVDGALANIEWPVPRAFVPDAVEFADCLRIRLAPKAST